MKTEEEMRKEIDYFTRTYPEAIDKINQLNAQLKGYLQAKKEVLEEVEKEIKLARVCLNFKMIQCKNKDCLNLFCPLNKKLEEKE